MAGKYQNGHLIVGTVYRVVQHIGTGGMGSLYEVEDTTVGRHYVLKTLHPELIDREDIAARMQQEARALGRLSHPNIVEVITAGVTGDALKMPFYVMERLVGHNLRTVIDARKAHGGIGFSNAFRICIDVLDALQHAHANGMVHRDVKPENIFLHRGASGATVTKLLDFGIVRMLNRQASLTRGKFIGTLRYSSPEQITGQREIGPASDIYSMGLVLYELLAGRGPFDDAGDAFKVGAAHAGQTPPPPSRFHVTPPAVEKLILQALEKQPEMRPASAGAFAQGLRGALQALQATPTEATQVELLTAHHPIEVGGEISTRPDADSWATDQAEAHSTVTTTPSPASSTMPDPSLAVRSTMVSPQTPVMAPVGIDRNAPTRVSPPSAPEIRVPANDTQVSAGTSPRRTVKMDHAPAQMLAPPPAPVPALAAAPAPAPVEQRYISTVQTRPRKDRALLAILAAAIVAAAMIAGAFILVRGRLRP
jgi:serine/threonine-protein kinase